VPTPSDFFEMVSSELLAPLQVAEKSYLEGELYLTEYLEHGDATSAIEGAAEAIERLRGYRLYRVTALPKTETADRRWQLLRDLDADFRTASAEAIDAWEPLHVTGQFIDPNREPPAQRLVISFDHRLSKRALIAIIHRQWSSWRRAGWVRQTHPLGALKLALINHVCRVCEPGATWDERLDLWNDAHLQWRYPDRRPFQSAFRSAEESLTGERGGLEWFHDPIARLPFDELIAAAKHDRAAKRRLRALLRELVLYPTLERQAPMTEAELAQGLGTTVAELTKKAPSLFKALARQNRRKPSHAMTSFLRRQIAESYALVAAEARARGESVPNTEDVMPELIRRIGPDIAVHVGATATAAAADAGLLKAWLGTTPDSADEEAGDDEEAR
jgi:hypothetical protein